MKFGIFTTVPRWVLGSQMVSLLVGERAEECLFSGTLNLGECIVMVASSEPFINHGAVQ
jgi:hypothetical protein